MAISITNWRTLSTTQLTCTEPAWPHTLILPDLIEINKPEDWEMKVTGSQHLHIPLFPTLHPQKSLPKIRTQNLTPIHFLCLRNRKTSEDDHPYIHKS